jgi:hypothetical protein
MARFIVANRRPLSAQTPSNVANLAAFPFMLTATGTMGVSGASPSLADVDVTPADFVEKARGTFSDAKSKLATDLDIASISEPNATTGMWQIQLEGDADDLQKLLTKMPDDIIGEPALERHPASRSFRLLPLELAAKGRTLPPTGVGNAVNVVVHAYDKPLPGATASLVLTDSNGRGAQTLLSGTTESNGYVSLPYDPNLWMPMLLMIEPQHGFWNRWLTYPQRDISVDLQPLPKTGPIGWWHLAVSSGYSNKDHGAGIRIGVVDTGVGPHPYLSHVKSLGAVINGQYDPRPEAGLDAVGHGTHVSGIIAARPVQGSGDYVGIAQGADVVVIRVFPEQGNANQGDIAEAIQRLALDRVDVINLSLGGAQSSTIERDAVRMASNMGTLCIGAAGNNFGQPIMYPAGYPEVVSVSAVGVVGAYPAASMEAYSLPIQSDRYASNYLYLANFSNIGPEMTCTAPGVGIISTVPSRSEVAAPYAAQSGTSMACPIASAALATVLANDLVYRGLPRSQERVQRASTLLAASLKPLGLSPLYIGNGLSQAWPI